MAQEHNFTSIDDEMEYVKIVQDIYLVWINFMRAREIEVGLSGRRYR
ncbi:MAG: hypothetical protein JJW00_02255 [Sulfurimonas sp.]|nr:hypothetical protein [Sulfurimonas sp.]